MRYHTLQDWLRWLESCHPREIELGLERVAQVAKRMQFAFEHTRVITVAGTNGKGSCVALLESLLSTAGYRIGTYTSPHLLAYNERIRLQGQALADQQIMAAFDRVDKARADTSLTYFEFATLAALDVFNHQQLDVIVLEVGLGGRLDAVNIVDADIALITSIGIDHQDWLGTDREQIGWEKAGIMRAQKPVVCGDPNPPDSIGQAAQECGAILYQRDQHFGIDDKSAQSYCWWGTGLDGQRGAVDKLSPPLLSIDNIAAVLQTLELLSLPLDKGVYASAAAVSLPGRFQRISYRGQQLVLDVAHNPAAATNLADHLRELRPSGQIHLLLALMRDKDCQGFVAALSPLVDHWYVTGLPDVPRALAGAELARHITVVSEQQASVYASPEEGIEEALARMAGGDILLVAGSFFLVGAVMTIINSGESA